MSPTNRTFVNIHAKRRGNTTYVSVTIGQIVCGYWTVVTYICLNIYLHVSLYIHLFVNIYFNMYGMYANPYCIFFNHIFCVMLVDLFMFREFFSSTFIWHLTFFLHLYVIRTVCLWVYACLHKIVILFWFDLLIVVSYWEFWFILFSFFFNFACNKIVWIFCLLQQRMCSGWAHSSIDY